MSSENTSSGSSSIRHDHLIRQLHCDTLYSIILFTAVLLEAICLEAYLRFRYIINRVCFQPSHLAVSHTIGYHTAVLFSLSSHCLTCSLLLRTKLWAAYFLRYFGSISLNGMLEITRLISDEFALKAVSDCRAQSGT